MSRRTRPNPDRLWLQLMLSRRRFLQASGVALGAAGLAACEAAVTPGPSPTGPGPTPTPGETPTGPPTGGVIRIAFSDGDTGDTLDPNQQDNIFTPPMFATMYDTISRLDTGFQANAALAESWEPSEGGKRWTFRLRKGVEFHDGGEMKAADVIYSLRRSMHPESGTALVTLLGDVLKPENMKALDEYTIQFDLETTFVFFPNPLGTRYAHVFKDGTTDFTKPIGTGPFVFKEFTPGQSFATTRNPNYWQEGRPYADELTITNIPEAASKLEALLADQVDFIDNIEFAVGTQLEGAPDHEPMILPDAAWHALICDLKAEPFTDRRVVMAMKMALDRQQVIDTVYAGFATMGYDNPIPGSDPYFPADVQPRQRDVAGARALLAEAGYPNGLDLPFPLITVFGFGTNNLAAVAKEQLAEAGIRFEIQEGGPTFWDEVWLKEPFYIPDWNRRHPGEAFPLIFSTNGTWNQTHIANADIDRMIVEAGQTTDFEEQKALYGQIVKILAEEDGTVLPAYAPRLHAKSKRLQGVDLNFVTFMNFDGAYFM